MLNPNRVTKEKAELNKDVQERFEDMNLSESPTSNQLISSRLSRIHKLTENTGGTKMDIGVMKSSQNEDPMKSIQEDW